MTFEEKVDAGLIYKAGDEWVDTEDFIATSVCENCPAYGNKDYIDICCDCGFDLTETNIEKIFEHYKRINTNMWFLHLRSIHEWYKQAVKEE